MGQPVSFVVAALLGAVLVPIARKVGTAVGLVDRPGKLKIHTDPVPLAGGAAVIAATLASVAIAGRGLEGFAVAAVLGALALGLVDDVRPLSAWLRVGLLGGIATVLAAGGIRLEPIGAMGGIAIVVGAVLCANAVNVMDGQDALAGGLVAVAALTFAILAHLADARDPEALALALAASTAAFLWWNRPPAKIFLGNGGAYAVGFTLAVLVAQVSRDGWRDLAAAVLALGVFAFEVLTTLVRRAAGRGSLTGGDRLHSYDVVSRALAGGRMRAALTLWIMAVIAGGLAVAVAAAPVPFAAAAAAAAGGLALACARWLWNRRSPVGRSG